MIIEDLKLSAAQRLEKFFPQMERQLRSARMDENLDEYLSKCISRSFKVSVPSSLGLVFFGIMTSGDTTTRIGLISFPLLTFMAFITFANYPKIKTKQRTRQLEKDVPYALRDMLIEIKSGITLYEAMRTVTSGYGEASKEFTLIIKDIDGGKSTVEALEESIVRNPSEQYRRAMWQLNNSIKSGTDISITLQSVVDSIIKNQKLEIKKYGKELNPYILVYLLLAVVGPSLGITGLIVMSSFTGITVDQTIYFVVLFFLFVIQIFFINLVRSKRPEVKS